MVRGLVMIAVASVITSPWFMRSAVGGRPGCASPPAQKKRSPTTPTWPGVMADYACRSERSRGCPISAPEHHRQPPSGESDRTFPRVSYGVSPAIVKRMRG